MPSSSSQHARHRVNGQPSNASPHTLSLPQAQPTPNSKRRKTSSSGCFWPACGGQASLYSDDEAIIACPPAMQSHVKLPTSQAAEVDRLHNQAVTVTQVSKIHTKASHTTQADSLSLDSFTLLSLSHPALHFAPSEQQQQQQHRNVEYRQAQPLLQVTLRLRWHHRAFRLPHLQPTWPTRRRQLLHAQARRHRVTFTQSLQVISQQQQQLLHHLHGPTFTFTRRKSRRPAWLKMDTRTVRQQQHLRVSSSSSQAVQIASVSVKLASSVSTITRCSTLPRSSTPTPTTSSEQRVRLRRSARAACTAWQATLQLLLQPMHKQQQQPATPSAMARRIASRFVLRRRAWCRRRRPALHSHSAKSWPTFPASSMDRTRLSVMPASLLLQLVESVYMQQTPSSPRRATRLAWQSAISFRLTPQSKALDLALHAEAGARWSTHVKARSFSTPKRRIHPRLSSRISPSRCSGARLTTARHTTRIHLQSHAVIRLSTLSPSMPSKPPSLHLVVQPHSHLAHLPTRRCLPCQLLPRSLRVRGAS